MDWLLSHLEGSKFYTNISGTVTVTLLLLQIFLEKKAVYLWHLYRTAFQLVQRAGEIFVKTKSKLNAQHKFCVVGLDDIPTFVSFWSLQKYSKRDFLSFDLLRKLIFGDIWCICQTYGVTWMERIVEMRANLTYPILIMFIILP